MKRLLVFMILFFAFASLQAYPGKIVKAFKTPAGFSTGITFDGHYLWLADYQSDSLYQIDPNTGAIVHKIPSPGFWPMGLAWDGKYLWNVDKMQKKIFQVDPKDGSIVNVFEAPSDDPEALTWDGKTLWVSDARSNRIMSLDMNDGTAVVSFKGPARRVNGLTFDGKYLWATDRLMDELYMIDPQTGEVILITDTPGPYPRGLAYDGTYLWCVDFQNDSLYQIVRKDKDKFRLKDPRKAEITLTHEVRGLGDGTMQSLNVYFAIPETYAQQEILSVRYTPKKSESVLDRWGQPIACFYYKNLKANFDVRTTMKVRAKISAIDYFIFPEDVGTVKDIPKNILKTYTQNGSKYMLENPYIKKLAKQIVGNETNPYWMARKIFDYLHEHLTYKLEGGWNVAPVILKRGTGSCSEYSISFIALARAAGLPARYVGSVVVRGDAASMDNVFHRWTEVYLPHYGWIPFDPSGGDQPLPRDQARFIGHLSNRFLITTHGGGDSKYLGWYYNYNQHFRCDPKLQVTVESFAEWQPIK